MPFDPVVSPRETPASVTDHICAIALNPRTPVWWWVAFGVSLALLGLGALSVGWLFATGVQAWGNNWPVMWGFDLINYVWWIGIASGGTLTSALFFLTRSAWRTSVNRIAESMTIFAAACACLFPLIHLGRPWFFYWLFPYPNTMVLWPQFRSPLLWDFIAIITYVVASALFWFLGLMPDLAALRDRAQTRWRQVLYGVLAMGFRGTGPQWRRFHATYGVIAGLMAPLVVSVHSIVGLDFAGAATPGWYSTAVSAVLRVRGGAVRVRDGSGADAPAAGGVQPALLHHRPAPGRLGQAAADVQPGGVLLLRDGCFRHLLLRRAGGAGGSSWSGSAGCTARSTG